MQARTEEEKMLAGERYNILDPALDVIRQETKRLMYSYNLTTTMEERYAILQKMLGQIGRTTIIEPPYYCSYGKNTYIGEHCYLNFMCTILDNNVVRIGDHVMIGPAVQIYTAAHPLEFEERIAGWEVAKAITIGDNVWIGGAAVLLPGVTIGRNAVLGAGSVVTHDVAENTVVAGNPARVIREIEQRS